MRRFTSLLALGVVCWAFAQDAAPPATQPGSTLRKPEQAEILQSLLRERDQPKPILPTRAAAPSGTQGGLREVMPGARQLPSGLLTEGSFISERPGKFARESGRPMFVFSVPGTTTSQAMEILPNQFLEAIEREVQSGVTEFIVTAEVTVYSGRNYLLIRKILRRVNHGNLSP